MVSHAFGAAVAEFYDMSFAADDQRLALEASGVEYEIIGGGFVTPRVHSQLTYPVRGPVFPFQGGWFPNTRGFSRCLT